MSKKVIIIGGGASGLTAAISASEAGADVILLERLPRVGKKILLTGNGRCNLGNESKDFSHYHGSLPYAAEIIKQFDTKSFFQRLGVWTRMDAEGRIYPMSGTAASVLDALRFSAEKNGVQMICDTQVTGLRRKGRKWQVNTADTSFFGDAVICAAGGSAAPECGTDGNLFPILERLGLRVIQPQPSLCPIPTDQKRVKALKGLRVRAEAAAFLNGKILRSERGEVQFTERALSGICIFNLSGLAASYGNKLQISLDLLPDIPADDAENILEKLVQLRGNLPAADLLTGLLPKRIAETCVKEVFGKASLPAAELIGSKSTQMRLLSTLKNWRFPVTGLSSFRQAQVTAGGIAGDCLTETLEVRGLPGLYICGELADLDGDCGGFNLTWSWCSGELAGREAARK